MIFLLVFAGAFTLGYVGLLCYYLANYKATCKTHERPLLMPLPFCSVIIAVRNEETRIRTCLQSVTTQTYPVDHYEVIVVNDGSEDDTVAEVQKYPTVQLLHTPPGRGGKKSALMLGIAASKGEIVVTTDGDCQVVHKWLESLINHFGDSVQMVTGPVFLHSPSNAFERFQALDIAGLALITGAGIQSGLHHLANGANMAFRRTAFDAVSGFSGNTEYASGDDVFLVQEIENAFPGSVRYVSAPEAFVLTYPCTSLPELIQQRLRWATKNSVLRERSIYWIWIFIWLTFALNLILLATSLVCYTLPGLIYSGGLLCLIAITEYIFLTPILSRYRRLKLLSRFPVSFLLHYAYVLFIGLSVALQRRYIWKGRYTR